MRRAKRISFYLLVILAVFTGVMVVMMIFSPEISQDSEAPAPLPVSSPELSAVPEDKQESKKIMISEAETGDIFLNAVRDTL